MVFSLYLGVFFRSAEKYEPHRTQSYIEEIRSLSDRAALFIPPNPSMVIRMSRSFGVGAWHWFSALGVAFLLLGSANAQPKTSLQQQPQSQSQQHPAEPESSKSDGSNADPSKSPASNAETKITPQQAEQLFRDVDTILAFAGKDSSLPVKREIKRRLASREEVVTYLKKNMAEDKDVKRLRRTELVLKKFGLLPKDFDLQTFLVSLLEEQVAGYYDSKTKTVNL